MARAKKDHDVQVSQEVADAKRHADRLLIQAERLAHTLNVHLDRITALIE